MTVKEQIVDYLQMLPDDVTFEDAIYNLVLRQKIDTGLRQADAGECISSAELLQHLGCTGRLPDNL